LNVDISSPQFEHLSLAAIFFNKYFRVGRT